MTKKAMMALLLVPLFCAGCQSVEEKPVMEASVRQQEPTVEKVVLKPRNISVYASDDANDTLPTTLDIVFLYNRSIVSSMPKNAPSWFDLKAGLRKRHAADMDVVSLEVPPGSAISKVRMPQRVAEAVEVVAYASYLNKQGIRKIRLTPYRQAAIYLNEKMIEAGNK
jgi:hypothetical protein